LLDGAQERRRNVRLEVAVPPAAEALRCLHACAGNRRHRKRSNQGASHAGTTAAAAPERIRTRLASRAAPPKRVRAITAIRSRLPDLPLPLSFRVRCAHAHGAAETRQAAGT